MSDEPEHHSTPHLSLGVARNKRYVEKPPDIDLNVSFIW